MQADLVALRDEEAPSGEEFEIFHPLYTWKRTTIKNYVAKPLLKPIFEKGKLVYKSPDVDDIKAFASENQDRLWEEVKRLDEPHSYYVDLSQGLFDLRNDLIKRAK